VVYVWSARSRRSPPCLAGRSMRRWPTNNAHLSAYPDSDWEAMPNLYSKTSSPGLQSLHHPRSNRMIIVPMFDGVARLQYHPESIFEIGYLG